MKNQTRALGFVATAVFAVSATGCGSTADRGTSTGSGSSSATKMAMVFPGPVNDKGYNQTGYEGLKRCGQEGLKTSYVENVQPPDFVKTFETEARGNPVVFGHGFEFGDVAQQVAPKFPKVKFVVTANPVKPSLPNVLHTTINSTQGAYMAGALAGLATKTHKVAGIEGFDFPVLKAQMAAFKAGLQHTDPKATFKVINLGTTDDVAKGKEAARGLAASGVDVVYHIADAAGVGVIAGAKASGIKAIGWGVDQNAIAPSTVISSQIANMTEQIADVCTALKNKSFKGGRVRVDGLKSGLTGLTRLYNRPASDQTKLDAIKKQVENGKLTVPSIGGGIPGAGPAAG